MHQSQKSKALVIIALFCIATGIAILFCEAFNWPVIRDIPSRFIFIKLNTGVFSILAGVFLLLIQYQTNRYRRLILKKTIDETSVELLDLSEKLKNCNGHYQAVIEQSFDAIYVIDFEGNFIDVNASLCTMTGYTRDELLKLNIKDIIDPAQLKTDPFTPHLYNYDEPVFRERRLVGKSGNFFDVEINVKKISEDRLMVIANDITKRKQLEIELHHAQLKFRTLAEKSAVGIYVVQKEKFVYINLRFAEVFGYRPFELINMPTSYVDAIISEDYRAIVRKNLRARYMGEVDYINYEVTGLKKDGTLNHVEFSGSRAVIDGEPTIIGTMIDITERWKAEEVLKRYEANLQTILDTTDIAYASFDKNLRAVAFNQMAAKFSAAQHNHVLKAGDSLADYFPGDRLPQFKKAVDEVLAGKNINYEIKYPQAGGSSTWYYVRLFPIVNSNKEIFGVMLALTDITERKLAENNLHAAYERIQKHISSIKEMAWKQSHLVRSPLANLKGLVALLQDDPSDKEIIKNIQIELERLDNVIIEMAKDASDHDL